MTIFLVNKRFNGFYNKKIYQKNLFSCSFLRIFVFH